MTPFTQHRGIAAPLLRINVDTDAIIPSREMRTVGRSGLSAGLFAGWRYRTPDSREPEPTFVLNQDAYAGTSILLSGANFGCGSSREHAVWALAEYGIRCVIAPSFGSIFQNNCIRNGLLPVCLDEEIIRQLATAVDADPQQHPLTVDLEQQEVSVGEHRYTFQIAPGPKRMLLLGLDAIGETLLLQDRIDAHVEQDRVARAWAYR